MRKLIRFSLMIVATCFVMLTIAAYGDGPVTEKEPALKGQIPALPTSCLFLPYVSYFVGSWPEAVAIGDVNGDGRNDVVMTTSYYFDSENDYHIFVFLQNASGTLDSPVKYPTHSDYSHRSQSIAIGDVNNDGRAEVVVGNSGSNIEVFFQNASGGLDLGITYPTINSDSVKIGDLNNDSLLDVVGIGWSTNSASVFLQNSNGTLDPAVTYSVTYGGYDEVDVGDVNNDGLQDIVVMSGQDYAYPNIGVLLQRSDGTFGLPVYYDLGGNELPHGLAIGNVNGDTLDDVVITYGGNSPNAFIGIFLQNGSGTLNQPLSYPSYDMPEPVEIGDVNLDGRNDIIVAHGGWDALGVYLQSSSGSLMAEELYPLPYASHYNPQGLAVGDINGDGLNDVAIADQNNGLVLLYHSPLGTPYSLSGIVNGDVTEGVTITLSGPVSRTTTSGSGGSYSFTELGNGTYTVTPSKPGYAFTPSSRTVDICSVNQSGVDFVATTQCSTWNDVIVKYNAYVSGSASWTDVIDCYNQYVSP